MSKEFEQDNSEELKVSGRIIFGCSKGDWTNRVSITENFIPGDEEDLIISEHVQAFFDAHNAKAHQGQAELVTLKVNLSAELRQKLIDGGHIQGPTL